MIINVYDFDDTLFRIPTHIQALDDFKMNHINDWYDHSESMNDEKYHIQCILSVADILKKSYSDPNQVNILITRRHQDRREDVLRILKKHDLQFHSVYVIGHDITKPDTLEKFIIENKIKVSEIEYVNIYEDSLYQIIDYRNKLTYLDFRVFFVDKTHLLEIGDIFVYELEKLRLLYK